MPTRTPTTNEAAPKEPPAISPEIIPPQVQSALRTLGVDPSAPNIIAAVEFSMMFGGPIPPPSLLAEYNKVIPGLAEKIVGWTEQQRDHRQGLERQQVAASQQRLGRGQIIGGGVAFFGLALAAIVGIFGNPWTAGIIAIVSVGGPTAAVAMAIAFGRRPKPTAPDSEKLPKKPKPPPGETAT